MPNANAQGFLARLMMLITLLALSACGAGTDPALIEPAQATGLDAGALGHVGGSAEAPPAPVLSISAEKTDLQFSWAPAGAADTYRLLESRDGGATFTPVGADLRAGELSARIELRSGQPDWVESQYR